MLQNNQSNDWLESIKINSINHMQNTAEKLLNPYNHRLSGEAKKRLRWLYILYYEQNGNVTRTAGRIGISRQWLSYLKSVFENNRKDPRSLEPELKAPNDTSNRKRIPKETEDLIIKIREDSLNIWGKEKIAGVLKDDYGIKINPNTVNKYLHIHKMIDPKISLKNMKAWDDKKLREADNVVFKVKFRPPSKIKDCTPGALVEKDMKYVAKFGQNSDFKTRDSFWYQHTFIDSFTRIRALELTKDFESKTAAFVWQTALKRVPFKVACANTDNGSENGGEFSKELQKEGVFHFYSNIGTPTDNPRVERSHLTDEKEFYSRKNIFKDFEKQKDVLKDWEYFYNFKRPHQALGYLTPMKFYELWKENPGEAYAITERWQTYLKKQRIRQAQSRKMKRKDQLEALMGFIDAKLTNQKNEISKAKLQLINCQLCSMA